MHSLTRGTHFSARFACLFIFIIFCILIVVHNAKIQRRLDSIHYYKALLSRPHYEHLDELKCLNLDMHRNASTTVQKIPLNFVKQMARIRNFFASYNMHLFLFSGSLLGWYRECTIIPHTLDVDFAMFMDELNNGIWNLEREASHLGRLTRVLGKPRESFEVTIGSEASNGEEITMDIFFMKRSFGSSWITSMKLESGRRYKYRYPAITSLCKANLLGEYFLVPCNTDDILTAEYGNWRVDVDSSQYNWTTSPRNAYDDGYWSRRDLDRMRDIQIWIKKIS